MAENQDQDVELLDEDEIITLYDDDNKPVKFYEVACIEYQGEFYALMQPVEPMEGLGEDEALIFKVREEDEDNDVFEPVTDERVLDAVFDEYLKAAAEAADECGCGCEHNCDCDHDGCDCDHHGDDECDHHGHGHGHGDDDGECGCGCEHKKK